MKKNDDMSTFMPLRSVLYGWWMRPFFGDSQHVPQNSAG